MKLPKTVSAWKAEFKKGIVRQYNLPSVPHRRWGTNKIPSRLGILRGMLWTVFALYIRLRDAGKCITCGQRKDFRELQAGHYMPVGSTGLDLWFDEKNVNGECAPCNTFTPDHLVRMRVNLIIKWGGKVVEDLERRAAANTPTFWAEEVYVKKIKYYYKKINK